MQEHGVCRIHIMVTNIPGTMPKSVGDMVLCPILPSQTSFPNPH